MRYLKGKDCDGDPIFYGISDSCYTMYESRFIKLVSLKNAFEFVTKDMVSDQLFNDDEIIFILDDAGV